MIFMITVGTLSGFVKTGYIKGQNRNDAIEKAICYFSKKLNLSYEEISIVSVVEIPQVAGYRIAVEIIDEI